MDSGFVGLLLCWRGGCELCWVWAALKLDLWFNSIFEPEPARNVAVLSPRPAAANATATEAPKEAVSKEAEAAKEPEAPPATATAEGEGQRRASRDAEHTHHGAI